MSHSFLSRKRKGKYARFLSVLEKCIHTADIIVQMAKEFLIFNTSRMRWTTLHGADISQWKTGVWGSINCFTNLFGNSKFVISACKKYVCKKHNTEGGWGGVRWGRKKLLMCHWSRKLYDWQMIWVQVSIILTTWILRTDRLLFSSNTDRLLFSSKRKLSKVKVQVE